MPKTSKSSTTTDASSLLDNPHPGVILLAELIEPLGMSQSELAKAVAISPRRINEIVSGKRSVTADTDLRLCRYFGLSEGFFLRLQNEYDLMDVRRKLGPVLEQIRPRAA